MDSGGYGEFRITREGKRIRLRAHRVAYTLALGLPLNSWTVVRHRCDNPLCVSILHLTAGTPEDNVADRVSRGRSAVGEQNGRSKLCKKDVAAIKRDLLDGAPIGQLARGYLVDRATIRRIRDGKTWRHVEALEVA